MVDHGIHHLPLVREGRLVGMVTDTDLLRHESRHPLFVRRQLDRAAAPEDLAVWAGEVTAAAVRLIGSGSPAGEVTRFLASAHDALYVRVARDGEAALGLPPCPYALLVLGSGARGEPTLGSDQDHALVLADDPPADAAAWFADLAEHLAATLERCGLPRCPGDVMATNPARRLPRRAWQQQFSSWIQEPEEEALLDAAICFDFRQLHGDLDAEAALRPVIRQAAGNRRFLGRLARAALRRRPPLGFLRQLRGDHHGRIDLERTGPPRSSTWPGCSPWRPPAPSWPPWPACGRQPSAGRSAGPPPTWRPPSTTSRRSACATRPAGCRPARPPTT